MLRGLLVVVATAVGLIVVVVGVVGLGLHRLSSAQKASDQAWQPPAKMVAQADATPAPPVAESERPPEPRPLSIMLWAGEAIAHGRVHFIDRDKARQARVEEVRDIEGDRRNARKLRREMMAGHPVTSFLAGWQDSDDWAEWTIELPKAGEYEIDLTYAFPKVAQSGEFIVKIADQSLTFRPELTRGQQSFRMSTVGRLTLPAGKSTLTLRAVDRLTGDRPSMSVRSVQVIPAS
ncbi:MAG: putative glycosyl hydrolase [Phycisphaerales bacterium]|nr:putative glycosyl hydrolase [Phycisphaerales bacterium]